MSDIPYDIAPTQVAGGYDITITATDGHRVHPTAEMSGDGTSCTIHVRDYSAPRVGQEACIGRMFVKVADVWFDSMGRCMIRDAYTDATMAWEV